MEAYNAGLTPPRRLPSLARASTCSRLERALPEVHRKCHRPATSARTRRPQWQVEAKRKGYEARLDAHNDAELRIVSKYSKPCALKRTASGPLGMRTGRNPEIRPGTRRARGLCGMRRREEALHATISKAKVIEM
jgi:hypothetical protein